MTVNRLPGHFRRAPGTLKALQGLKLPLTHNVAVQEIGIVKKRGLHPVQAGYDVAHRAVINPFGRDYTVVYGAWGGDSANPLLATDAKTLIGVDINRLSSLGLEEAVWEWGRYADKPVANDMQNAVQHRYNNFFWFGEDVDENFERIVIRDLKMLGVRRSSIRIVPSKKERYIDIDFKWAYPGGPLRDRKIRFFKANLIDPDSYPPALTALIARGFDVYFQKSAMKCIHDLHYYLPRVIKRARKCLLISPAPGLAPGKTVDESVAKSLERERYFRLGHINAAYADLFRQYAADPSKIEEYNWLVELWVRSGTSGTSREKTT